MALNTTQLERYYNAPIGEVYGAMKHYLQSGQSRFTLKNADDLSCSCTFSSGISMTTWGENLTASAVPSGDGTLVRLTVAGKLGSTAAGFQNSHNVTIADEFFSGVSKTLSASKAGGVTQTSAPQSSVEPDEAPEEQTEQRQEPSTQETTSVLERENPPATKEMPLPVATDTSTAPRKVRSKAKLMWTKHKVQFIIAAISVAIIILCATIAGVVSNNIQGQKRLEIVKKVAAACNEDNKITTLSTGQYVSQPALQFVWEDGDENKIASCIMANTGMSDSISNKLINTHSSKDNSTAEWDDWKASWTVDDETEAATITIQYVGTDYSNFRITHTIADWKTADNDLTDNSGSSSEETGSSTDNSFTVNLSCSTGFSNNSNSTEDTINGVTSQNYRNTVWKTGKSVDCSADDKDSEARGIKGDKDEEAIQVAFGNNYKNYEYYLGSLYAICASTNPHELNSNIMNEQDAKDIQGALVLCPDHPRAEEMKQKAQNAISHWADIASKRQQGLIKDDGTYAVPSEMSTGTWKTMSEKVTNCYWEMQDANGQTINNNFISSGIAQTITISNGVAGFSSHGCGAWEKQ